MDNMTWSYISFALALLVGGICFLLVKHTADEFDRWYDPSRLRVLRVPAAVISLIVVVIAVVSFVR